LFVWAYTQVMRDGYVPLLRLSPPLALGDLEDVVLPQNPADGAALTFDRTRRRWTAKST
jgi:hypothetical protein